jgi:hypothetical protein
MYDLNIFYKEDYDLETEETTWDEFLTIDVYIREEDEYGVRNYNTETLFTCTPEESVAIAEFYPENEYGSDWWEFLDNFIKVAPARIVSLLKALPSLEDPSMDIVTSLEPNAGWWVTKNEDMLF